MLFKSCLGKFGERRFKFGIEFAGFLSVKSLDIFSKGS